MKTLRILAFLLVLGMLAAAPAAIAYDDHLPALIACEAAIYDGDPDEPGPLVNPHHPLGESVAERNVTGRSFVSLVRIFVPLLFDLGVRF